MSSLNASSPGERWGFCLLNVTVHVTPYFEVFIDKVVRSVSVDRDGAAVVNSAFECGFRHRVEDHANLIWLSFGDGISSSMFSLC